MAKKVSQPKETIAPLRPDSGRGPRQNLGRLGLAAGLVVVLALGGAILVKMDRRARLAERVQGGLPAGPDLAGKPAELVERLAKATAAAKSPTDPLPSVAELGRLYHANGYNREAEACWRLLHTEQPREARWGYYLADLARMASNYDEMATLLAQTVKLAPDYAPAWLQLANLQFKTGQLNLAAHTYQQRLALVPGDPYARLWLARIALQLGQRAEARQLIVQLLKDTPEFSSGHNLYAEMLAAEGDTTGAERQRWLGRETGRFREADDPWLDALQDSCFDYERLCVLGTIEYQTAHGDRGKSLYERAIALRPADPGGYELLASLYAKMNEPAKARDVLEQCLPKLGSAKPTAAYYHCLSKAYRDLKQPAEAVRVARLGLEQRGESLELYSLLGTALSDLGQPGPAIAALQKALALNSNDAESNYNLGLIYLALDRWDDAKAALLRSLTLQPTFPNSLTLLGRLEMEAGRWQAAEKFLRPLYESHPEAPESRHLMANWQLSAGAAAQAKNDLAGAEGHYREGLGLNRDHPDLQASLGVLLLLQGRLADALNPLENYHRLQPDNPQSCLFLGQAYAATGRRDDARRILTEGARIADRAGNTATANNCREILEQL